MSVAARPGDRLGANVTRDVFVSAVACLAVASVVIVALRGVAQPGIAAMFGALVAIGEVARIRLPDGREFAPLAAAGALAYALLLAVGNVLAGQGAFQVIMVVTAAVALGAVPHLAVGRAVSLHDMAGRVLLASLAALIVRPLAPLLFPARMHGWATIGALIGVVLIAGGLEMVITTAARSGLTTHVVTAHFLTALRDEVRRRAALGSAIAATALLIATAAHVMGWTALLVCTAPLVVTQVAYRRYVGTRATYLQTVRALSGAPEVGGYVASGHSRRVSQLALRLGRELGMSEAGLRDLEYAALMHDIGQLSLSDPKPGGATVHAPRAEQRRIAQLGAEVVRQTGVLDRVANIIESQAEPGAGPGATEPPLASRIIRAANAYDDLTGGAADAGRARVALDHLKLGSGQEYDAHVVRALARIT